MHDVSYNLSTDLKKSMRQNLDNLKELQHVQPHGYHAVRVKQKSIHSQFYSSISENRPSLDVMQKTTISRDTERSRDISIDRTREEPSRELST